MRLKLLASSLTIILASLLSFGLIEYYLVPHQSVIKALSFEKQVTVETKAFTATRNDKNWLLTLKKSYFPENVKSIALTYNGAFYGIFILSDKIFVPVLVMPEVEVVISPLDADGNALTSESFIIGEQHDKQSP